MTTPKHLGWVGWLVAALYVAGFVVSSLNFPGLGLQFAYYLRRALAPELGTRNSLYSLAMRPQTASLWLRSPAAGHFEAPAPR